MDSKQLFLKKLEDIHTSLMARYHETAGFSSAISGTEREVVMKELLQRVLPSSFRIGSGSILDASGKETGQVDAVIERPFSLSFPIGSESNRLYVADSVCAAFEIKSDLYRQGKEARTKIEQIRALHRFDMSDDKEERIIQGDALLIPSFIIGFKGHTTEEGLQENFIDPRNLYAPSGVLCIESELFYGQSPGGNWHMAKGKRACILGFLNCLANTLRYMASATMDLTRYERLVNAGSPIGN
ncbi:hypothetical protein PQR75_40865 [Paraburkholderia fungorum]|uniref:DUF6602 domain-containing protein n=1 Tax=Paraburkholderia fungorum TaxID=134537 RepID=UPI0038BC610D